MDVLTYPDAKHSHPIQHRPCSCLDVSTSFFGVTRALFHQSSSSAICPQLPDRPRVLVIPQQPLPLHFLVGSTGWCSGLLNLADPMQVHMNGLSLILSSDAECKRMVSIGLGLKVTALFAHAHNEYLAKPLSKCKWIERCNHFFCCSSLVYSFRMHQLNAQSIS